MIKSKRIVEDQDFRRFVLDYLLKHACVDVLNAPFVDAVIDKFNWPYSLMPWGAHKCPRLGRKLRKLHRGGSLDCTRIGLTAHESGFPNWVYSYSMPEHVRAIYAHLRT